MTNLWDRYRLKHNFVQKERSDSRHWSPKPKSILKNNSQEIGKMLIINKQTSDGNLYTERMLKLRKSDSGNQKVMGLLNKRLKELEYNHK